MVCQKLSRVHCSPKSMINAEIIEFLHQSNLIEGVDDADSLMQAIYAWEYLMDQDEMNTSVILKTHKILMLHQPFLRPDEKGYFRTVDIHVGETCISHELLREKLENWCFDTMNSQSTTKKLHVIYEKIHPFVDGNGRTGRMFMNWTRIKRGQSIIIIHFGEEQNEYYKWFND